MSFAPPALCAVSPGQGQPPPVYRLGQKANRNRFGPATIHARRRIFFIPAMAYTLVQYNVNQAMKEEDTELKWDNRIDRVVATLDMAAPDLMCLQELRNLDTSNNGVNLFIARLDKKYAAEIMYYGPGVKTFALVTLYDRTKFYVLGSRRGWFSIDGKPMLGEKDRGKNRGYLAVHLMDTDTHKEIWVVNTHFHMHEYLKWFGVKTLISEFKWTHPVTVIISGDFNFFEDKDGEAQRQHMLDCFQDMAYPLVDPEGAPLSGAFFGYEHDAFKKPLDAMSRLDHIFVSKNVRSVETSMIVTEDGKAIATRNQPSDHACIVCRFTVNQM